MSATLLIERVGPLTTIQDEGRFGYLSHGVSAPGPMDARAFRQAGLPAGSGANAGIEFSMLGLDLQVADGEVAIGWSGGLFNVAVNGRHMDWPGSARLRAGDRLAISAGTGGNYGYLRFGGQIDVPEIMGSRSTSLRAKIGGLEGRALRAGDELRIRGEEGLPTEVSAVVSETGPIRFTWGLHTEVFGASLREKFVTSAFRVSSMMDRMGVRLRDETGVFADARILSLVSDPVVVGDIQILGDGTPIVLGRDHQPTGGYPRIGTIISADLDRFFQLRPNAELAFAPVGIDHAQALLRSRT
jgi:biotin-dependent carboxylase-like uncharacterized protein